MQVTGHIAWWFDTEPCVCLRLILPAFLQPVIAVAYTHNVSLTYQNPKVHDQIICDVEINHNFGIVTSVRNIRRPILPLL
jgi:hypothetical protein